MAQNDLSIANADGATVRADINSALQAQATKQSGTAAPSTTYAYQDWADTATGTLKIRNAGNSAWLAVGTLGTAGLVPQYDGHAFAVSDLACTGTNDNAGTSKLGEYLSGSLAGSLATTLSSGTAKVIVTLALTPGDWDVQGVGAIGVNGTTSVTAFGCWVGQGSAAFPWSTAPDSSSYTYIPVAATGISTFMPTGRARVSTGTNTNVYLNAVCNFSGTARAYGHISARRVR